MGNKSDKAPPRLFFAGFVMFWMRTKAHRWGKISGWHFTKQYNLLFHLQKNYRILFPLFLLISSLKGDNSKDRKSDFLQD